MILVEGRAMKALVRKELREVLPLVVAAMASYLILVVWLIGGRLFDRMPGLRREDVRVPFVDDPFNSVFLMISIGFLLALGLRQSAWEELRGTYLFLLHRPISRRRLFLIKLATGASVFVVCASVPILIYGIWASLPGGHPNPFAWSMTGIAWQIIYFLVPLYLGAFLTGLYPARWYGTRLLPLAGVAALLALAAGGTLRFWYLSWPAVLLLAVVLTGSICHVAMERDYA
jgi:hypothetical protein